MAANPASALAATVPLRSATAKESNWRCRWRSMGTVQVQCCAEGRKGASSPEILKRTTVIIYGEQK